MTSVGEILRTERESQGRAMAAIAKELCIAQRYLRAIEEDNLESLPGTFFYRSFTKQYAAILGIDEKRLLPGIEALAASAEPLPLPGANPRHPLREPVRASSDPLFGLIVERSPIREIDPIVADANRRDFPDRRIGLSLAGLIAVLLACSGVYAWWNKATRSVLPRDARQVESPVMAPVRIAETIPANTPVSAPAAPPTVAVAIETGSDGLNHVVLNLAATEETWLSITSDGTQTFSGLLRPSQTWTLTAAEVAKMRVGNAGGLEVLWNGKPIGPIGPRGRVRVVLFTPERVQILPPSQPL